MIGVGMRIGASYFPVVGRIGGLAAEVERLGLDDLSIGDSPQLAGELYASLMAVAEATDTIEIVAGVTNSITRDAVVTASGIATVAAAAEGRVVCGLGRGDSAVRKIGKRPDRLGPFEEYVKTVRRYLDGEEVVRDGTASSISWVRDLPRVPIEIVATGPRVLEIAARHADRIGLGLGADAALVAAGVRRARAAVERAGRDPNAVEIGAYVPCVLAEDPAVALEEARYIAAKFANFRALAPPVGGEELPPPLAAAVADMRTFYDYDGDPGARASARMSDDFVRWMAMTGPADLAVDRLKALHESGVAYVRLMSGFHRLPLDAAVEHHRLLGEEVIPALRAATIVAARPARAMPGRATQGTR